MQLRLRVPLILQDTLNYCMAMHGTNTPRGLVCRAVGVRPPMDIRGLCRVLDMLEASSPGQAAKSTPDQHRSELYCLA